MKPGTGAPSAPDPDRAEVWFVLGKGGVGKSVLSAGLAARAAGSGRSTLLVRIGESLHDAHLKETTPVSSAHGFDVLDLDSLVAMDEYVEKVVRIKALSQRITGSEIYRRFFAAAPGLKELVLLGRIRAYAEQAQKRQSLKWHTVVVDCPSSGHGLLMLETPFAALRAVPVGPFARLASGIIEWLRSDVKLAVIAIPEEMAVVEAIEFEADLRERTGLTPTVAILNRVRADALSAEARRVLGEVEAPAGSLDRVLLDCAHRVHRRTRLEDFHRRRLARGLGLTPLVVGELPSTRPARVAAALSGIES